MALILNGLAFLGRHGVTAFALSLLLGFALPALAATVRPLLGAIIFIFIAVNIMRADLPALRRVAADPLYVAVAVLANTLIPFTLVGAAVAIIGRAGIDPGLLLGLALVVAAPPLVAAPAYALLLGFSNAVPLTVLVLGMAVSPLIAPLLAELIAGAAVPLDRWALTARLAVFLGVAGLVGLVLRRLLGDGFLARRKAELDGVGVVLFFIFAIALTDGVSAAALAAPWRLAGYVALAFGICCGLFIATWAIWRQFDQADALTLALATGLRNMGLLVAVLGVNDIPASTFLFFSVMQFPVYFAPWLLRPFFARPDPSAEETR